MKILKKQLNVLLETLSETKLNLADSRIRDEFLKTVIEKNRDYLEAQQKIYIEFCIKKEDGTPDITKDMKFQFKNEDIEPLNTEMEVLNNEEVDLEVKTPEKIKEFINKTNYNPKVGEVEIIDEILTKVM